MTRLQFGEPYDSTPSAVDVKRVTFPFQVVDLAGGALRDTASEGSISVGISGTLMAMWGFPHDSHNDPYLQKTLFEFARQEAWARLIDGSLEEHHSIRLMTNTAPKRNPFDPAKIPNPDGWVSPEFDLDALREEEQIKQREERKIGFQLPSVVETTLGDGGTVSINGLPFQEGDEVEVSVRRRTTNPKRGQHRSFRGTVIRYDNPFGSVAEDDWNTLE